MRGTTIRPTTEDDWESVRALRLEMLRDTPKAYGERLADAERMQERDWRRRGRREHDVGGTTLAAIGADGRWLGTMGVFVPGPRVGPLLVGVYVAPSHRGRAAGVADGLLDEIEAWAAAHGSALRLHVHQANTRAQAFYARRGYEPHGCDRGVRARSERTRGRDDPAATGIAVSGGTDGAAGAAGPVVRWLLLDVGGVLELVDDAAWPGRFRARWAERLGMTTDDFSDRLVAADLPDASRQTGVVDRYWGAIGSALGLSADQLAVIRADFWDAYCGTLNQPLYDFLAGLRGTIGLAILSNSGDGAREEEERRFRFSAVFDPICYSHEIGVNKPDAEAFRITLERLGADPDEVFFVDDVPENIEAARALGIGAHLHVDTDETIRVLDAVVRGSGRQ